MLVATTNTKLISEQCLDKDYSGMLGHYLLTREIKKHQSIGQKVGVGIVSLSIASIVKLMRC